MPGTGSHSEISVDAEADEPNDKSSSKEKKKNKNKKKKKKNNETDERVVASVPNPRKFRQFSFRIGRKPISPKPSSSSSSSSLRRKWLCFCIVKPPNPKDSSSPPSDPNDENFTHEMLSVLLETNDFSSKECNPHPERLDKRSHSFAVKFASNERYGM